jgi:cyanuric acid amidohydrolase
MTAPDDLSGFEAALDDGRIDPAAIIALLCKTRGNGLANDFTKPWIDLLLRQALAARLGTTHDAVGERALILVSGGSEGVVSPHLVVIQRGLGAEGAGGEGLVAGFAGGVVDAARQGTASHALETAGHVRAAMAAAGIASPAGVGLVLVRAPSAPRRDPAVRRAAAVGAAIALGEVAAASVTEETLPDDVTLYAHGSFVVARHDGAMQRVLVIGNAVGGDARFRIASGVLADPLDLLGVASILRRLGLAPAPQLPPEESARVVAVIAKGDAPAGGTIRGLPHAMLLDNDVAMHRHARAAYGALLAAAIGHGACLVSGGAEGQGPPDGGFAAIITATHTT